MAHRRTFIARRTSLIAVLAFLPACAGMQICPPRHAVVRQAAMSCAELNQTVAAAAKRMGYSIESFTPAATGTPGKVTAVRRDADDSAYTMTIELRCSSAEAVADAVSTLGCAGQIGFPNDFQNSFRASMAKKVQPPTLISEKERTGLLIDIEPLRSDAEVGVALGAADLMPVKVTIDNRTARVYRLDDGGITLTSQDGAKVRPVAPADAAKRVASAKPGEGSTAARVLGERSLPTGTIAADAKLEGFLYVPRQAYRRATVRLVDQEADEPEGFQVEF